MSQISENNKKIAKNTIFIYFRIFTTMIIGLYSSRIVLQVLGISDFGIFSVVGGVLAMFTFITASLGTATSRFFNVEMGKENGDVKFSVNEAIDIASFLKTKVEKIFRKEELSENENKLWRHSQIERR